ncbi:16565_t:CDS:2 [Dentiscutata erythropus]|uniref:16565_t:CDS:1 n=1 Tax=Dentiscutata erythropus TaxID=1348616 RepID=A0A9N9C9L4_9GLOM|nr:16565_t:CDS:2 [Dentiscutata erythropus]
MNTSDTSFYKFVVVDKKKSTDIKEKPLKQTVVTMATPTPTTLSPDGKQTTEERKNEEIIQNNNVTIKKEDQEPETKPREKTSVIGNIINLARNNSTNQSKGSSPSPISPTTSVASVVTTPSISDNTSPSNNAPRSSAVDISSTENTVTPDSSLVPQAPANTLYTSPLSISPTTPPKEITSEPQPIQSPQTPQTPQKSKPFDFVKRMIKKPSQPVVSEQPTVSESPNSTPVTESTTTDKTNGLSVTIDSVQEENDKNLVEETVVIEKEETSEPVTRDIEPKLNDEVNDELKHPDKRLKGVPKVSVREFITRYSNVVLTKLQQEFDELDRRMYSGVNPNEVSTREIDISKSEREQLLGRPDTESDVQSNGDARSALADAGEALNERAEKLDDLNERLNDLSGSSSEFARLAAELKNREANRKWYQIW